MKKNIITADELQLRISALKTLSGYQEQEMKTTVAAIRNELKPVNLIKGAFSSTVQSPGFGKKLIGGAIGLAAGFLTKKIFLRGSAGIVKKALGTAVELGIAKIAYNKADKIKDEGLKLLRKI